MFQNGLKVHETWRNHDFGELLCVCMCHHLASVRSKTNSNRLHQILRDIKLGLNSNLSHIGQVALHRYGLVSGKVATCSKMSKNDISICLINWKTTMFFMKFLINLGFGDTFFFYFHMFHFFLKFEVCLCLWSYICGSRSFLMKYFFHLKECSTSHILCITGILLR